MNADEDRDPQDPQDLIRDLQDDLEDLIEEVRFLQGVDDALAARLTQIEARIAALESDDEAAP